MKGVASYVTTCNESATRTALAKCSCEANFAYPHLVTDIKSTNYSVETERSNMKLTDNNYIITIHISKVFGKAEL